MAVMKIWKYSSAGGKLEKALVIDEKATIPSETSLAKDELLIQVIAASINPVDYIIPESGLVGRVLVPRPASPGLDFCGRVIAKHPSNSGVHEQQLVFGAFNRLVQHGTLSEYIVVPDNCCAILPIGIEPIQAAAVGTAATTAYQSLMPDTLRPGAKIFINGGSGGVGTWAIQLAKVLGAEVVAICSWRNMELCRSLGADEVLDYTKVDLRSSLKARGPVFDLFIDNVGNDTDLHDISSTFLKEGGTFVQVGTGETMSMANVAQALTKTMRPSFFGGRDYHFVNMKNTTEFFTKIGTWMSEGKVKAVIDSEYTFQDVPSAFKKLKEGRATGKIVIQVKEEA